MQYCDVITNPRWQTAANTKNDISAYLIENDPIMMKFGAPSQTMTLILTKVRIFKFNMVDKHGFGHNSAADYLNFAKFCTKTQNPTVVTDEGEKINFENPK